MSCIEPGRSWVNRRKLAKLGDAAIEEAVK
jgi:hypothetical protein